MVPGAGGLIAVSTWRCCLKWLAVMLDMVPILWKKNREGNEKLSTYFGQPIIKFGYLIDGFLWSGGPKYFGQPDQIFGTTKPGIGGNQKQYTR